MKEQKSLTPGAGEQGQAGARPTEDNGTREDSGTGEDNGTRGAGQKPQGSGSVEQMPVRPSPTMHNEIQTRKRRGRLGRDAQVKLGKTLQAYFDDVVKEGVPDRFKQLLQEYEERKDKGSS